MNVNTSKKTSFYTQGQRFVTLMLFILMLLVSFSLGGVLAAPHQSDAASLRESSGEDRTIGTLKSLCDNAIKNNDVLVRLAAIKVFRNLENLAIDAQTLVLSALHTAIKDDNNCVRYTAVKALGKHKPQDDKSFEILSDTVINDQNLCVRHAACQALGHFNAIKDKALEVLVKATKAQACLYRLAAIKALGNLAISAIGAKDSVWSALTEATKDTEYYIRYAAVQALGNLAISAIGVKDSVWSALTEATKDQNRYVRYAACQALGKLSAIKPEVITILKEATNNSDCYTCHAASKVLEELGDIKPAPVDQGSPVRQAVSQDF